jgi:hypothetical protein
MVSLLMGSGWKSKALKQLGIVVEELERGSETAKGGQRR